MVIFFGVSDAPEFQAFFPCMELFVYLQSFFNVPFYYRQNNCAFLLDELFPASSCLLDWTFFFWIPSIGFTESSPVELMKAGRDSIVVPRADPYSISLAMLMACRKSFDRLIMRACLSSRFSLSIRQSSFNSSPWKRVHSVVDSQKWAVISCNSSVQVPGVNTEMKRAIFLDDKDYRENLTWAVRFLGDALLERVINESTD